MLLRLGYGLTGSYIGEGGPGNYMQDIVSSACFDIDATILACHDGTAQSLYNLVPVPADGVDRAGYDFWYGSGGGADGQEMSFNGIAGEDSAFYQSDGDDRFALQNSSGTIFENWNKTDASGHPVWMAAVFRTPASFSDNIHLWGNGTHSGGNRGMALQIDADGSVKLIQRDATVFFFVTTPVENITELGLVLLPDSDYVLVITWDVAAGTVSYFTASESGAPAANFGAATITPPHDMNIFARGTGEMMGAGSRLYAISGGKGLLGPAEAGAIINEYSTRHNRSYL